VVGLVAITPAAGYVSIGSSLAIGVIAAVVSNVAVFWKTRAEVDDTLDVFPCHGVGGMVGMLATAVFASRAIHPDATDGLLAGSPGLLGKHLLALFIVAAYSFVGSWVLYRVTDRIQPLRVDANQEAQGLDLSQHGESVQSDAARHAAGE
jgi:Amt family ammonium transporter